METEKVYAMPFAKIYPMLVAKAVRKGRTQAEVDEIIGWLTGYSAPQIEAAVQNGTLYGDFFRDAPQLNPDRVLIKGSVCGVKLESIEEPLMKEIRYLDKLVDELAKGKAMEKIKRTKNKGGKSSLSHTDRECGIILEKTLYGKDKHDERSGYYETP